MPLAPIKVRSSMIWCAQGTEASARGSRLWPLVDAWTMDAASAMSASASSAATHGRASSHCRCGGGPVGGDEGAGGRRGACAVAGGATTAGGDGGAAAAASRSSACSKKTASSRTARWTPVRKFVCCRATNPRRCCAGARGMPRLKRRLSTARRRRGTRPSAAASRGRGCAPSVGAAPPPSTTWRTAAAMASHGQRGRRRRPRRQWRRGRVGGARPPRGRHLSVARQLARQGRVRLELAGVGRFARRRRERPREVCVDAPDLENMLLPLRRRQVDAGALRRQGPAR